MTILRVLAAPRRVRAPLLWASYAGACARASTAAGSGGATEFPPAIDGADAHCASCRACVHRAALVCGACKSIVPLAVGTNFFALLEMPQTFDLDETALSASFKRLQRTVHPDHFAGSSGPQQALSAAASSSLNVAFAVLADPASRAQYILKLAGRDAIGEASSAGVSPELLAQVMEAREVLMEAGTSAEEVLALQGRTADALRACLADLRRAFATGDLALAASIVVALQYYSKLSYECGCWLDAPPPVQGKGA